jgi:tetratricopeptide (TPR) repeat protein
MKYERDPIFYSSHLKGVFMEKKHMFLAFIYLSIILLPISNSFSQDDKLIPSCNEQLIIPLKEEAMRFLVSKKYDDAALAYKKIVSMCPDIAGANMDYGSTLFTSASKYFHRDRDPMFDKEAVPILEEASIYLKKAISLYSNEKESNFWKAHAYYLLGDINHYGLLNLAEAEKMYRESLSFEPNYAIAQKELDSIINNKDKS